MFICSNFSFFLLLFKVLWPPVKFFNPPVLTHKKTLQIKYFYKTFCFVSIVYSHITHFILFYFMLQTNSNTTQHFDVRSVFIQFHFIYCFFFIQFKNTIDPIAEIVMKIKLPFVSDTHRRVVKSNTLRNWNLFFTYKRKKKDLWIVVISKIKCFT